MSKVIELPLGRVRAQVGRDRVALRLMLEIVADGLARHIPLAYADDRGGIALLRLVPPDKRATSPEK